MPPLPVITGITRCTLNWESDEHPNTHNVLHFRGQVSGPNTTAQAIADGFVDGALLHLSSVYILNSVDFIALDGTSPQVTGTVTDGPVGNSTGDTIQSACSLIDLYTGQRGPRGRGRVFLGPIGESAQSGGHVNLPEDVSEAWVATIAAWSASDAGDLVVASYVHADANDVTNAKCRSVYGSQRRRLNPLL